MFCVCGGIKALVSVNGTPAAEFGGSEVVKEMKVYGFGGVTEPFIFSLTKLDVRMSGRISGNTWQHKTFSKKECQKRWISE